MPQRFQSLAMPSRLLLTAALLLTASPALAADGFNAWATRCGTVCEVTVTLTGQPNALYSVFTGEAGAPFSYVRNSLLRRGRFDAFGVGTFTVPVPGYSQFPTDHAVSLHAFTRGSAGLTLRTVFLPLKGNAGTLCQDFDPNFSNGPNDPVPGMVLSNQWDLVGMSVSGVNNEVTHPQVAAVFDSTAPNLNDPDLVTPGYGPGNTVALGNLIIIPENDVDADNDGLIDEPDDEALGGIIRFDFADPYRICSATFVDIDDVAPSEMRFYIGAALTLETIPIPFQGDNGVQTLLFDKLDVRRFEVVLGGSGAIGRLGMIPCPMLVDLDETPFGKPLGLLAGSWITNQFASVGMTMVDVMNAHVGHPDKAILFDSANPTGDDFDLETPGYGVNNTEALGMVLIIAENDVDANNDGLVDDPDDEHDGGQFRFVFSETVTFFSALVLDVDGVERDVFTFYDVNNLALAVVEINALGDNSVQMLTSGTPISGVKSILATFNGSGALARLRWCPDSNN